MSKEVKKDTKTTNEKPVKIKGSFLDVFKVVKKDAERRLKQKNKKS